MRSLGNKEYSTAVQQLRGPSLKEEEAMPRESTLNARRVYLGWSSGLYYPAIIESSEETQEEEILRDSLAPETFY